MLESYLRVLVQVQAAPVLNQRVDKGQWPKYFGPWQPGKGQGWNSWLLAFWFFFSLPVPIMVSWGEGEQK